MKTHFLPFIVLAVLISSCNSTHERSPSYGRSSTHPDNGGFERVVIYGARVTLTVNNTDSINSHLSRVAARYEGYVLSAGSETSVIRVRASMLTQALNDICKGRKVGKKDITGQDVTEDYQDSKIRLENSYKARQRYLELLAKAENVEAALKVEKELERLNTEIDRLEGHIKRLQHLSEYSTITVIMQKKIKPGILGYVVIGLYRGIKWLFVRN